MEHIVVSSKTELKRLRGSRYLGLSNFEVKPKKEWFEPHENCPASDYTYPPIEEWLSAFGSSVW